MGSIDSDAAYWRKMYEERMALEEDGFGALLAERDRLKAEVDSMIANGYTAAQRAENDRPGPLRAADCGCNGGCMTTLKVVPDNTGQDEREVKLWQGGMITGLVFGVPIGALPVAIVWMCVAYEVNAIQIVVLVALAIFFSILLPGGQRFWETVLGLILRPRGKR